GRPLTPMIAWYDLRTTAEMQEVDEKIGRRRIYQMTGQFIDPKYGLFKMMWTARHCPEAKAKMVHWLSSEDYILYRLSGEFATEYTMAGRTLCFDLNTMDWSQEMLDCAGFSKDVMPKAYPGGTKIGEVTDACAAQTGLLAGTAVCTGGHDHCCAAVGVNIFGRGVVMDSMGTAEALMIATDQLVLNDDTYNQHYAVYPHCGKRLFRVLAATASPGVTIDWIFRNLGADLEEKAKAEGNTRYNQMEKVCEGRTGRNLLCYPMFRGTMAKRNATATFVQVGDTTERGDLIQAVLNGLCYEGKRTLDNLERVFGQRYDKYRVVGGISKSDLIMQKKSDVIETHLEVPVNNESACFGAALLSAIGVGDMVFKDAERFYRCSRSFDPNPAEDYGENYEEYMRLRDAVLAMYP
ncbi:MAG: hypothetical protein II930_05200, partial [Lachnospiraceae bacterium]|nr:hypothetical protein [Lachnospiraceae bacterium]